MKFLGKWMYLEDIIPSEVTQSGKKSLDMHSLISGYQPRNLEYSRYNLQNKKSKNKEDQCVDTSFLFRIGNKIPMKGVTETKFGGKTKGWTIFYNFVEDNYWSFKLGIFALFYTFYPQVWSSYCVLGFLNNLYQDPLHFASSLPLVSMCSMGSSVPEILSFLFVCLFSFLFCFVLFLFVCFFFIKQGFVHRSGY